MTQKHALIASNNVFSQHLKLEKFVIFVHINLEKVKRWHVNDIYGSNLVENFDIPS